MNLSFVTLANRQNLIGDVLLYPLKVNQDERGTLVETLRTDWKDIFDPIKLPFAMQYFSTTAAGIARDENRWHFHKFQEDRFGVIQGDIVVALYDARKNSKTYQKLNLVKMGELEGDEGQFLLLIPKEVLHCYLVVSKKPAILVNFPTKLYSPDDEGRIDFSQVGAKFNNGTDFSWNIVREFFNR